MEYNHSSDVVSQGKSDREEHRRQRSSRVTSPRGATLFSPRVEGAEPNGDENATGERDTRPLEPRTRFSTTWLSTKPMIRQLFSSRILYLFGIQSDSLDPINVVSINLSIPRRSRSETALSDTANESASFTREVCRGTLKYPA